MKYLYLIAMAICVALFVENVREGNVIEPIVSAIFFAVNFELYREEIKGK